ncbi:hypothetical protein [Motilimonas pumila]|uniref:Uncharacterized protein n=1 Tax=Motilimonas pumila TaxID=2303987 RepID=A0A418Y910_9GAMM|nr:hypothetical protein [Motilimonas pumila]RJG35981.1 hypothetical protein D1Z90_20630 [Motilimonas pumila]
MDIVSFMDIEETDKDLIISFALDIGDGYIKTLLLHRTIFCEFIMPEDERGTKVSLEGSDIAEVHINTLESVTFNENVMKIKARFSSHEINLRKIESKEVEQMKESLMHHNFDDRFKIKFT